MGPGAGGRAKVARIVALSALPVLAGCGPAYFAAEDAPEFIRKGGLDVRLVLTRAVGPPLASVLRQFNLNHGKLHRAERLQAWLRPRLEPLDVVMVRAKAGFTRANVPTHFSHSLVWLGAPEDMKRLGAWDLPQVRAHHARLGGEGSVIEASGAVVQLGGLSEITDVDEIVILRPRAGGAAWARAKYAGLLGRLGTPFDNSFDLRDTTRLSCIELIAEAFPEFAMPVRYSKGRYALVPDDLVRLAIAGSPEIAFSLYVVPSREHGFERRGMREAAAALTHPSAGPAT